jgi:hypothetical protein
MKDTFFDYALVLWTLGNSAIKYLCVRKWKVGNFSSRIRAGNLQKEELGTELRRSGVVPCKIKILWGRNVLDKDAVFVIIKNVSVAVLEYAYRSRQINLPRHAQGEVPAAWGRDIVDAASDRKISHCVQPWLIVS